MSQIIIYSTFSEKAEAEDVSRALVEARLVACANILPVMSSVYLWEGEVQSSDEVAVIYKTTADMYGKVESEIKRLHSYDCPCVISWDIERGSSPFLEWLNGAVS